MERINNIRKDINYTIEKKNLYRDYGLIDNRNKKDIWENY